MNTDLKKNELFTCLKAAVLCAMFLFSICFLADVLNFSPNLIDRMGGFFLLLFNCLIFQLPLGLIYIAVFAFVEKYLTFKSNWHKWWYYPIFSPVLIIRIGLIATRLGY